MAVDIVGTNSRWFFNDELFASVDIVSIDQYPFTVEPSNATYNTLVGGVDVQILAASQNESNLDVVSFNSTLTVNISALQIVGVTTVSCGLFSSAGRSFVDVRFNSSAGLLMNRPMLGRIENDCIYIIAVPYLPTGIQVQPKYNTQSQLTHITMQWNEVVISA